jgi:hypothetical protein
MPKKDLHQEATDEFVRHVKEGFKKAGGEAPPPLLTILRKFSITLRVRPGNGDYSGSTADNKFESAIQQLQDLLQSQQDHEDDANKAGEGGSGGGGGTPKPKPEPTGGGNSGTSTKKKQLRSR